MSILPFPVLVFLAGIFITAAIKYLFFRGKPIYLVDFVCFRPPESYRVPPSTFLEHTEHWAKYEPENLDFLTKVLEKAGIGSESYFPAAIQLLPNDDSLASTMEEIELVLFTVTKNLFAKRNIDPTSIDIIITNCSVACPTPSLASMIITRFGLRSDVRSFNLAGMGCSAGLISLSLAKDLLRVHAGSRALILSTESVTSNIYYGKLKTMLLANCLFRMGGAAILLSSREEDKAAAKYELKHLVRTHVGAEDRFYRCVIQEPDNEGITGVALSKSLRHLAGEALKVNVSSLAILVLPYSEQLRYITKFLWTKVKGNTDTIVPDFTKAFDHFCVHSGGKSVIETVRERLRLSESNIEASKMTLYKFGNTSSASTWYALSYLEAKGRVKQGNAIWQLAFGSGLKCNSAVWKCVNDVDSEEFNVWSDIIDDYPAQVPDLMDH